MGLWAHRAENLLMYEGNLFIYHGNENPKGISFHGIWASGFGRRHTLYFHDLEAFGNRIDFVM